jgi:hypothetical protein
LTGNIVSTFTDQLVQAKLKDDAARQKYQEDKRKKSDKTEGYKQLRDITNVTSGSLAANNLYCISKQEILDHQVSKAAKAQQKVVDTQERQEAAKIRDHLQFTSSFDKYKNNEKLLTKDYEVILKKIQRKNDSPIKTRIADRHVQLMNRRDRLSKYFQNNTDTLPVHPSVARIAVPDDHLNVAHIGIATNRPVVPSVARIAVADDHSHVAQVGAATNQPVVPSLAPFVVADRFDIDSHVGDHVHVDCRVGAANQPAITSIAPTVVADRVHVDCCMGATIQPVLPSNTPIGGVDHLVVDVTRIDSNRNGIIGDDVANTGDDLLDGATVENVTMVEI